MACREPAVEAIVSPELPEGLSLDTIAVRGGLARSGFHETAEALYLTSGYVYDSAEAAERAFTGEDERFVYSRYGNPTVEMFQERLRQLEGAEACFATASGMAAVFVALGAILKAGDRLVAARSLFGSCFVVCNEILPRWGIETEFVDGEDLEQWERALSTPADAVFFETPSNPMQSLVDVARVSELAHAAGAKVVLDNVFATPLLQRGLDLGADVIVYSGTKHIDGQGRVMGGAVLGPKDYIDGPVQQLMRHTGPALSPFNAWTLVKGLETMRLRVDASVASALRIAEFLESDPRVRWVKYPFLQSHPQYALATSQMSGGGTVVTFELNDHDGIDGKKRAFEVLNALRIVDISNNLGDSKSLITHPATTTHRAMGPEGRAAIGLSDSVVRLSVGLEGIDDLLGDLDQALG
ncbi:O-succinylhomoserine sulfhydrylase [Gordonia jinghuaiqii]|uniref:O-succinylhomoserine sulfhydrylase n=1 Tax=Gordonia jinghuaiqii TaxID=2758710 RepID=A0A7D7QX20_9ACTN|nr:O-succinylhomoserine sulfhydrylase [Gordonia jinghuaiqii]QMT00948.1 O-succinylhomoserine sulfhydrylase [Gordonia jinghuaiqii]